MLKNNPLLTKESLNKASLHLRFALDELLYKKGASEEQKTAGYELLTVTMLIAYVADQVFDYYPYTYFLGKTEAKSFPAFKKHLLSSPRTDLKEILRYAMEDFEFLIDHSDEDWDGYGPQPYIREHAKEQHVIDVIAEINDNADEIIPLRKSTKKLSDPEKPTAEEIKKSIKTLQWLSKHYLDEASEEGNKQLMDRAIQFSQLMEFYLNPLFFAWQFYHYGNHTDFWKDGDSMLSYMMFQIKAKEIIDTVIHSLETSSPFSQLMEDDFITAGLLKIYKHLRKQDLSLL